jgi:hypothetical protein
MHAICLAHPILLDSYWVYSRSGCLSLPSTFAWMNFFRRFVYSSVTKRSVVLIGMVILLYSAVLYQLLGSYSAKINFEVWLWITSPVRTTEELFQGNSGSSLENRGIPLRWPRDTLYPQKLALTSPTSGGRSIGIVRLRTTGHGVCFHWGLHNSGFLKLWVSEFSRLI